MDFLPLTKGHYSKQLSGFSVSLHYLRAQNLTVYHSFHTASCLGKFPWTVKMPKKSTNHGNNLYLINSNESTISIVDVVNEINKKA